MQKHVKASKNNNNNNVIPWIASAWLLSGAKVHKKCAMLIEIQEQQCEPGVIATLCK